MSGVRVENAVTFAGLWYTPKALGWSASRLRRDNEERLLRAIVARVKGDWTQARAAVLWDHDLCVFAPEGMVITDVADSGTAGNEPSGTVRVVPRSAIVKVDWYERADPTLRVADLDPGKVSRQAGFIAGFAGEMIGGGDVGFMVGTGLMVSRAITHDSAPVTWQFVEVHTRDERIELTICHDRQAAAEIVGTFGKRA